MSDNQPGLYMDPQDDERYEQRGDGKWYLKGDFVSGSIKIESDFEAMTEVIFSSSIGNADSDEKGTGQRELGPDKVPLQWVPVRFWLDYFQSICYQTQRDTNMEGHEIGHLLSCVQALQEFQEGKGTGREMERQLGPVLMTEAAKVFESGARKYSPWNWMKGMSWSVVTGCALRHAKAVFEGEEIDKDSGLLHVGHFACNIIMLAMFDVTYQEGNDFPKEEYFK